MRVLFVHGGVLYYWKPQNDLTRIDLLDIFNCTSGMTAIIILVVAAVLLTLVASVGVVALFVVRSRTEFDEKTNTALVTSVVKLK